MLVNGCIAKVRVGMNLSGRRDLFDQISPSWLRPSRTRARTRITRQTSSMAGHLTSWAMSFLAFILREPRKGRHNQMTYDALNMTGNKKLQKKIMTSKLNAKERPTSLECATKE